jgi:pimeloyl-ACP methyl ester carboxylesterase
MERPTFYLFIPGYYGISLVEKESGHRVWVDLQEILIGKRTLALSVPGLQNPQVLPLEPDQLIEKIEVLGPFALSGYGEIASLLKKMVQHHPERFISVNYDWRKDPLEAAIKIDECVEKIRIQFPHAEIVLVSHSLGSLITSYYLRYGTQDYFSARETWEGLHKVNKVVMAAAPFRGTLGMFRNMNQGLAAGLNHTLLSGMAYSSFPSSYFFLPPANEATVLTRDHLETQLPLWQPEAWWKNEWGIFQSSEGMRKSNSTLMKNYLVHWLDRARKFQELIFAAPASRPSPIPILYLQGTGAKTAEKGLMIESSSSLLFYTRDFLKAGPLMMLKEKMISTDGDSLIPTSSSGLPQAFQNIGSHEVKVKLSHLQLLQGTSQSNHLKHFLNLTTD